MSVKDRSCRIATKDSQDVECNPLCGHLKHNLKVTSMQKMREGIASHFYIQSLTGRCNEGTDHALLVAQVRYCLVNQKK